MKELKDIAYQQTPLKTGVKQVVYNTFSTAPIDYWVEPLKSKIKRVVAETLFAIFLFLSAFVALVIFFQLLYSLRGA